MPATTMGRAIPGLNFELDANACGKDFTPWFRARASTTGTGVIGFSFSWCTWLE